MHILFMTCSITIFGAKVINIKFLVVQNDPIPLEKGKESFFQECEVYWAPASNPRDLYEQLSRFKFREILRPQIQ